MGGWVRVGTRSWVGGQPETSTSWRCSAPRLNCDIWDICGCVSEGRVREVKVLGLWLGLPIPRAGPQFPHTASEIGLSHEPESLEAMWGRHAGRCRGWGCTQGHI